jgi:hypothetical protein
MVATAAAASAAEPPHHSRYAHLAAQWSAANIQGSRGYEAKLMLESALYSLML